MHYKKLALQVYFYKNGTVKYHDALEGTASNARWYCEGNHVTILFSGGAARYVGTIKENRISGTATNVLGHKTPWWLTFSAAKPKWSNAGSK